MTRDMVANRSTLAGMALLAACACGAGAGLHRALASGGIRLQDAVLFGASCGTNHSLHTMFVAAGLGLLLIGFSLRSVTATALAAAGCAAFAFGSLAARPNVMNFGSVPHQNPALLGFVAYVVGSVFLIAAFLVTYRSPKPLAAGTAMAGMALATGCSCCEVTGAVTALLANAGMPWVYRLPGTVPPVFFAGALIAAAGLSRLGGPRPALMVVAGSVFAFGGTRFLVWALPNLIVSGVNFSFVPIYLVYLCGASLMLGSFVTAWRAAALARPLVERVPLSSRAVAAGGA